MTYGFGPTKRCQMLPVAVFGELAVVIGEVIEQDGGVVAGLRCPNTPLVGQGVVTVCHGTIDGGDRAVVVFFESKQGTFTLREV